MRLNKLYNKYSEDEGVEELVKTYNMKLRSDFLSVCQCGVYLFDMVQFRVSGVRIGINVNSSVADPGSRIGYFFDPWIRDPGWEKVSIRIRDPG